MLDQMKAMGAVAGILKNKERLRTVGEQAKARIDAARLIGEAGGGAVRVTVTGRMEVVDVHIEPAVAAAISTDARAEIQGLIAEATNDALTQAQELLKREAARAAEESGLSDAIDVKGLLGSL